MSEQAKVVLITGGARRIGAEIARYMHSKGCRVIIHCHQSQTQGLALCRELNTVRHDSAQCIVADLSLEDDIQQVIPAALACWQRLDLLVNNASVFYANKLDPLNQVNLMHWDKQFMINTKAPYILSCVAITALHATKGCIVNITDIHGTWPLKGYSQYAMTKASLIMMTKSLAKELGPDIRVNAISPGSILWPEGANTLNKQEKQAIENKTNLKRKGDPKNIAQTVYFLLENDYISGQIIAIDGGRYPSP